MVYRQPRLDIQCDKTFIKTNRRRIFMLKKVAIIGANSYIGRNFIHYLKDKENYLLKLYDYQDSHKDGYNDYIQVNLLQDHLNVIDFSSDVIFLFTGKTGTMNSFEDHSSFIDVNEKGLLNLLKAYKHSGSKAKIVFPSTRLVYKGKKDSLIKEDDDKEFKTIYAMNKYSCEQYLKMYHDVFNINYLILRISVPYGSLIPGLSSYGTMDIFTSQAKEKGVIRIYGDGSQKRTFIYIKDLCSALEEAISDKYLNNVFNIGGADVISIREVASMIARLFNVAIEKIEWPKEALAIESGDTVFDSSKFDSIRGFKYLTKFNEWIENLSDKGT